MRLAASTSAHALECHDRFRCHEIADARADTNVRHGVTSARAMILSPVGTSAVTWAVTSTTPS